LVLILTALIHLLTYLNKIYFLQIPPLSDERKYTHKNNKTLSRRINRSSDFTNKSIENDSNELAERDASTSGDSTTNSNFAVLFANTASVESLTHWAKSDLLLPYIEELRTFWLGAAKKPFKLRLRAPDPFLSDLNSDSADPFLDIHP
jgi:hypothetical protein